MDLVQDTEGSSTGGVRAFVVKERSNQKNVERLFFEVQRFPMEHCLNNVIFDLIIFFAVNFDRHQCFQLYRTRTLYFLLPPLRLRPHSLECNLL